MSGGWISRTLTHECPSSLVFEYGRGLRKCASNRAWGGSHWRSEWQLRGHPHVFLRCSGKAPCCSPRESERSRRCLLAGEFDRGPFLTPEVRANDRVPSQNALPLSEGLNRVGSLTEARRPAKTEISPPQPLPKQPQFPREFSPRHKHRSLGRGTLQFAQLWRLGNHWFRGPPDRASSATDLLESAGG